MKNKKDFKLSYQFLIVIAIVVPIALGLTYAYFLSNISGDVLEANGTALSGFDINLVTENDGYVSANNIIPIKTDMVSFAANEAVFSVETGINEYGLSYTIDLTNIQITNNLKINDFKWELIDTDSNTSISNGTFYDSGTTITLGSNTIFSNTKHHYKLRLYILENNTDQSSVMNGTFSGKISITAELLTIKIPSIYTEVKNLSSSRKQYIDTGHILGPKSILNIKFMLKDLTSWYWDDIFGAEEWHETDQYANTYVLQLRDNSGNMSFASLDINNNRNQNYLKPASSLSTASEITIDYNNKTINVDGKDEKLSYVATTMPNISLGLFGLHCIETDNATKVFDALSSIYLYSYSYYENNILIQKLIPCIRNSDSKPGLYDSVNNVFLVNEGSGEFGYETMSGNVVEPS